MFIEEVWRSRFVLFLDEIVYIFIVQPSIQFMILYKETIKRKHY